MTPYDVPPPVDEGALPVRRRFAASPWLSPKILVGGAIVLLSILAMLFGRDLAPYDYAEFDLPNRLLGFGQGGHLLGTDELGRDLLSRTLVAYRWSFSVGLLGLAVCASVGGVIGVVAGLGRPWIGSLLSGFVDLTIAFPYLVLAVAVVSFAGRSLPVIGITLGFVFSPYFARVVLAEVLGHARADYVEIARLSGVSEWRIAWRHILPAIRPTVAVTLAFTFGNLLIAESALSFVGLGPSIGVPTWGAMLSNSREFLSQAPAMLLVPGGAIASTVVAANLIGDGVREFAS